MTTGKLLHIYGQHSLMTLRVQYSPDGTSLASTGYDYIIRLHATRPPRE